MTFFFPKICKQVDVRALRLLCVCPVLLMTSEVFQTFSSSLRHIPSLVFSPCQIALELLRQNVRCECQVPLAECTVRNVLMLVVCCIGRERDRLSTPQVSRLPRHLGETSEEKGLHLRPSSSQQRWLHRRRGIAPQALFLATPACTSEEEEEGQALLLTTTVSTLRFTASSTAVLRRFLRTAFLASTKFSSDAHFLSEKNYVGRFMDNCLPFILIDGL